MQPSQSAKSCTVRRVGAVLLIGLTAAPGWTQPTGEPPDVATLFQSLVIARGNEYRQLRGQLLEQEEAAKPWLERYLQSEALAPRQRVHARELLDALSPERGSGQVAAMIAQAREAGTIRRDDQVAPLGMAKRLRALGPSSSVVNETLSILLSESETEDVLAGLMRGLATVHEVNDPAIEQAICQYTEPGHSVRLQMEALESLRVRCIVTSDGQSCPSCSLAPIRALDLFEHSTDALTRMALAEAIGVLGDSPEVLQRVAALADAETDSAVRESLSKARASIQRRLAKRDNPPKSQDAKDSR